MDLFIAIGDTLLQASWNAGSAAGTRTSETLYAFGIKGIKKVLTRFIGSLGIAVAIYDFSSCMEWI